jgi:hypothetical protein
MKYLIVYDPKNRETILIEPYMNTEGERVRERRLKLEIQHRGKELEVLVLQAESEESLHVTHARYFGKIDREAIKKRFST